MKNEWKQIFSASFQILPDIMLPKYDKIFLQAEIYIKNFHEIISISEKTNVLKTNIPQISQIGINQNNLFE